MGKILSRPKEVQKLAPATLALKTKSNLFVVRGLCTVALAARLFLSFSTAAEFTDANWTTLGTGMNGPVEALAVSGSNVYAGGRFTQAGGSPAGYIAKWDGSIWTRLGSGMNGHVYALAVAGTNLYAGGSFSTAGGISAHNIARWNGSSWTALGQGIGESPFYNGYVFALAVGGSNVYAGGRFGRVGGFVTANNVARWNGSSWAALGSGTSGFSPSADVLELALSGNTLYAGGDFTTAGFVTVNHIARWDGLSWTALGSGMGSGNAISVYALAVSGGTLYAAGLFTSAGGTGAADVARWSGSSWSALGVGMYVSSNYYPSVNALAMHGNDLYAGGDFTYAGGGATNRSAANRIAKWNSCPRLGSCGGTWCELHESARIHSR